MARARDWLDLIRAPAAFTVLGDTLVGAVAAGRGAQPLRAAGLAGSSVLLYWAGMALNDVADAELDAVERPERPIPSGRITRRGAWCAATALTVAGVALAARSGGRAAVAVAVPLAASIWTYDLVAKDTRLGPVVMSACRGLDVLLGAGADRADRALGPAAALTLHTASVTALSRGEVHGSTSAAAAGSLALTGVVTASAVASAGSPLDVGLAAAASARYVARVGGAQARAVGDPSAAQVRTATRAGILGMIPLQAALLAGRGAHVLAGALVGLDLVLTRRRARAARGGDIT